MLLRVAQVGQTMVSRQGRLRLPLPPHQKVQIRSRRCTLNGAWPSESSALQAVQNLKQR